MNAMTKQQLHEDIGGANLLRDFLPLGARDTPKNNRRRGELMSSLPGRKDAGVICISTPSAPHRSWVRQLFLDGRVLLGCIARGEEI
jgi:hypothetical protein